MDFEKIYQEIIKADGDFAGHMETIFELLKDCKHVTEFGVGLGQSTKCFLRQEGLELHSYEIDPHPDMVQFFIDAKKAGRNCTLHIGDTKKVDIEETDFLLVDSYHSYDQVKAELEKHGSKVRKYIAFHDTEKYGWIGQGYDPQYDIIEIGIVPAIDEFVKESESIWDVIHHTEECNGLTILKKNTEHNVKINSYDWHINEQAFNPYTQELTELKDE
jgi:hypothetical protein